MSLADPELEIPHETVEGIMIGAILRQNIALRKENEELRAHVDELISKSADLIKALADLQAEKDQGASEA